MNLASLFPGQQKDPASLLRLYVLTGAVSASIIVLLSGLGFQLVFSNFVLDTAETDSVRISHLLLDEQRRALFQRALDGTERLGIDPLLLPELDRAMRGFLHPFEVLKIKIYDTDRRILYSTEASLTGRVDAHNVRLGHALAGQVDSLQQTKEKAHDLADEPLLNVDVVETYVPIRHREPITFGSAVPTRLRQGDASGADATVDPSSGPVLGTFEIYADVTRYRDQIRFGLGVMMALTSSVLAAVFGVTFLLIRRGTRQLHIAQERLHLLAITDALTGIANRRAVLARGVAEYFHAERSHHQGPEAPTLCCVLLDIDEFKKVNDTYGHLAGDEVLRAVVDRVAQVIRPYDTVGRYGGEEFVLLLPDTAFQEGLEVAERIRTTIGREPFLVDGNSIQVTVSLGLAGRGAEDRSLEDLLRRADEGLYQAKGRGRNRVEWIGREQQAEREPVPRARAAIRPLAEQTMLASKGPLEDQ